VLGHGIGELSGKAFRIAHMGHVNAPMVLGVLSVIEMALGAMGIPHGSGGRSDGRSRGLGSSGEERVRPRS